MQDGFDAMKALLYSSIALAAIATTAFPVLYSKSPWRDSKLGRAMMFHQVGISFGCNLAFLSLYIESRTLWRVANIILFLWIALASVTLTRLMWKMNHRTEKVVYRASN